MKIPFTIASLALGLVTFSSAATVEERLAALEIKYTTQQTTIAQQQIQITSLQSENAILRAWKTIVSPKIEASFDRTKYMIVLGNDTIFRGTNLFVQKGSSAGDVSTNGLGNLIVGFNNPRAGAGNFRNGSHNIVLGDGLNYSGHHNLIGGFVNTLQGNYSAMPSGRYNTIGGGGDQFAAVITGENNRNYGQFGLMGTGQDNLLYGAYGHHPTFGALVGGKSQQVFFKFHTVLSDVWGE
jgi:uncharacterized coiled-coil protein SlyX